MRKAAIASNANIAVLHDQIFRLGTQHRPHCGSSRAVQLTKRWILKHHVGRVTRNHASCIAARERLVKGVDQVGVIHCTRIPKMIHAGAYRLKKAPRAQARAIAGQIRFAR